jgi:quercetin dioxygenase-like cupin family protein
MRRRRILVATASVFCIIAMSHVGAGATVSELGQDVSTVHPLSADRQTGAEVAIIPVSAKRTANLHDPTISTFIVDYPPGASVVLHRRPSSGYVLVHVLSGTISASAWHAGVGTYHAGQTWLEPAFATGIAAKNPSANVSARTLVVLVTDSQYSDDASNTPLGE